MNKGSQFKFEEYIYLTLHRPEGGQEADCPGPRTGESPQKL